MSGRGGNGGPVNGGSDCQPVYRGARLASPKANVLSKLKVGDPLDLEVREQGNTYVLYALKNSKEAGTVTSKFATQIIRCIRDKGHRYIAYIKTLDGGDCTLEIRMES